jgi:hypothetical protein
MYWVHALNGVVLRRFLLTGLRNGLWRSLSSVEQALYRASMIYAGVKGRIVNARLLESLNSLMSRLKRNTKGIILLLGRLRAKELNETCLTRGTFAWCPSLSTWLKQEDYRLHLGVTCKNTDVM